MRPQALLQAGLLQAAARLVQLLEAENSSLADPRGTVDWPLANARKQQATFELQRLASQPGARDILAGEHVTMARLRELAQANQKLLSYRIEAGRAICERLAAVIREAEWDGTYGPRASMGRGR